jgi:hypothetical protein
VSFVKNLANKASQIVNGSDVVKNYDTVQAFATFTFTKTQYDPLPKSLTAEFQRLRRLVEATTISASAGQQLTNVNNLLNYMDADVPAVAQANSHVYLDLADTYMKYRQYRADATADPAKRDAVIRQFREWLSQSPTTLSQEPTKGPRVGSVYSSTNGQRYPILVFPYALTDDLIVSAVAWQLKLHDFVAHTTPLPTGLAVEDFSFAGE